MEDNQYPLATLVVLFFRQEQFVQDTVAGALSQTYPNLEIIFSDDHSPDNTFDAIQKAVKDYSGPHRIIINRNLVNMGLVPHVNRVLFELSHGDYIFLNGGDDVSTPNRVSWSMEYFLSDNSIMSVTGSHIKIDKNGREIGALVYDRDSILKINDNEYISSDSFMTGGVALSFRKTVLDVFGKMKNDCPTEDSVLRFRSILLGPTLRSSKVFLKYRIHDNNLSNDIYKLRTDRIAAQYQVDLGVISKSMPTELIQILNAKISYYSKVRQLQEKRSKRLRIFREFSCFRFLVLKYRYLHSIKPISFVLD